MDFSPKSLSEKWKCRRQTVLNLIHAGQLEAFNIAVGKRPTYRIPAEAVERFENERLKKAEKPQTRRVSAGKYY